MTTHEMLALLWRSTLISSLAICLVLALRLPARRWLGAQAAYALWLLVPCALAAMLLPAPTRPLTTALQVLPDVVVAKPTAMQVAPAASSFDPQPWLLCVWLAGALALLGGLAWQQRRYLRALGPLVAMDDGAARAQGAMGSPALVGALFPRIVLPADFEARFDARERELVLAHERAHLGHGDAQINALVALLRCLQWFNPLFHFAASRVRIDQELACDARVIARFPEARRCYADAMLKAQLVGEVRQELHLPVGCYWPSSHPLKERISMLKSPLLSPPRRALAHTVVMALALGAGYASWAAQPGEAVVPLGANRLAPDTDQMLIQTDVVLHVDDAQIAAVTSHDPIVGPDPLEVRGRWVFSVSGTADGTVRLDNQGGHWLNRPGKPFAINARKDGESWVLDGIATLLADGTIDFSGLVKHNDAIISAPRLTMRDAEPAAIQIGEQGVNGFKGLKIDLVLAHANAQQTAPPSKAGVAEAPQMAPKISLGELKNDTPAGNASFRKMKPPAYPPEAVKAGMGANVILKVLLNEQGQPVSAEVTKIVLEGEPKPLVDGSQIDRVVFNDIFAKASIAAAMSWSYNPTTLSGKPVTGYVQFPIDYSLRHCGEDQHPCKSPVKEAPAGPPKSGHT